MANLTLAVSVGCLSSCSLLFEEEPKDDSQLLSFKLKLLECGETELHITELISSLPPEEVSQFRWQLFRGDEAEPIMDLRGSPDSVIPLGNHVLSGSYRAPLFNVARYHGKHIAKISDVKNNISSIFQDLEAIGGDSYAFSAALLLPGGARIDLRLREPIADDPDFYGLRDSVKCDELEGCELVVFTKEFECALNGNPDARLQALFRQNTDYLIDRISLIHLGNERAMGDGEVVVNGSFEDDTIRWSEYWGNDGSENGSFEVIDIPEEIAQYGEYTLRLTLVLENGEAGPSFERSVEHTKCI